MRRNLVYEVMLVATLPTVPSQAIGPVLTASPRWTWQKLALIDVQFTVTEEPEGTESGAVEPLMVMEAVGGSDSGAHALLQSGVVYPPDGLTTQALF